MGKKIICLIVTFILFMPFINANIEPIISIQDEYYLGQAVKSSFEVNTNDNLNGLFKVGISCDDFWIDYFVTLVDFEKDDTVTIVPPEMRLTSKMKGGCRLKISIESLDKHIIETYESKNFEVTDELPLTVDVNKKTVLPGDTITINGNVGGNLEYSQPIILSFDGEQYEIAVLDRKFTKELTIDKTISSGKHLLFFEAKDSYGNSGDRAIDLWVKPEIKEIVIALNKRSFKPGETIEIQPIGYDQAKEIVLEETILVKINDDIQSLDVDSYKSITYAFGQYFKPGEYTVTATYKDIEAEEVFTIEEIKELDIKLDEQSVKITNIGNVIYNDVAEIKLETDKKTRTIEKKIKLEPGEEMIVNLSLEVPTDNYDISVDVDSESVSLAVDMPIEDKRPLFSKITGAVVSVGNGLLSGNPMAAAVIMIIVIGSIAAYYIKKRN